MEKLLLYAAVQMGNIIYAMMCQLLIVQINPFFFQFFNLKKEFRMCICSMLGILAEIRKEIFCLSYDSCEMFINLYMPSRLKPFCNLNAQDDKPPNRDRWVGKVNFVEIRSFWHLFRSFDRMWIFFILCLQVFSQFLQFVALLPCEHFPPLMLCKIKST